MRPSPLRLGGGAQYPYPKEVWTPSGGWWSRPTAWKSNTAVVATAVLFSVYGIWQFSAAREVRNAQPTRPIPSMIWSKQARDLGAQDGHH